MRPIATDVVWSVCLLHTPSAVLKWLNQINQSRCRLGCGQGGPKELRLHILGRSIYPHKDVAILGATPG